LAVKFGVGGWFVIAGYGLGQDGCAMTGGAEMMIAELFFRQAAWLGLLLPWLAGLLIWLAYRRRQAIEYSDEALQPWALASRAPASYWPWRWPLGFWVGVLLLVALAGPRWALESATLPTQSQGVNHLVLLDASRSMTAQDRHPDRFAHAQNLLAAWAQRLPAEDRVGLMLFGTEAYWALPMTQDKALLQNRLGLLEAQRLPFAGTQLDVALRQGLAAAQVQGVHQLVLVTDGVLASQNDGLMPVAAAISAADVSLLVVGVGTTDPVGLPDSASPTGWFVYDGLPVTVPMERQALQRLAQAADGRYVDDRNQTAHLQAWFDYGDRVQGEALGDGDRADDLVDEAVQSQAYYDLTPWVVIALLAGLLWLFAVPRAAVGTTAGLLLSITLVSFLSVMASSSVWANPPADYVRWMQAGEQKHRAQQHPQAQGYFRQALLSARNPEERARSLYNLGLSYADQQAWSLAVEALEGALIHNSDFPEAAHNLALAQRQQALELAAQAREAEQGEQQQEQGENGEGVGRDGNEDPTLAGATDGENWGRDDDEDYWGEELPEREGQLAELPPEQQVLSRSRGAWQGQAVMEQQRLDFAREQRQADLQRYLQQIEDDQVGILFHLFEREAGFQARQSQQVELPGVKPW
jgi:Ca-activated chloride channel family protein